MLCTTISHCHFQMFLLGILKNIDIPIGTRCAATFSRYAKYSNTKTRVRLRNRIKIKIDLIKYYKGE